MFCATLLLAACTDAPDGEVLTDDDLGHVADDVVFYETIVDIGPDGMPIALEPRPITAGEQRRQNARRLAIEAGEQPFTPYVSQDVGCGTSAVWLYARTDFTGARICFRQGSTDTTQTTYLGSYHRFATIGGVPQPIGDWRITSGSYWPGVDRGTISSRSASHGMSIPSVSWIVGWAGYGPREAFVKDTPADFLSLGGY